MTRSLVTLGHLLAHLGLADEDIGGVRLNGLDPARVTVTCKAIERLAVERDAELTREAMPTGCFMHWTWTIRLGAVEFAAMSRTNSSTTDFDA